MFSSITSAQLQHHSATSSPHHRHNRDTTHAQRRHSPDTTHLQRRHNLGAKYKDAMVKVIFDKIINSLFSKKRFSVDERTLRREGIETLINDERWIRLFTSASIKKSPTLEKTEAAIRSLLDEKTRLHMESNINKAEKQVKLNRIAELAAKSVGNDSDPISNATVSHDEHNNEIEADDEAKDCETEAAHKARSLEIEACKARLLEIDEREHIIELRDAQIDADIKKGNIALLDDAVVYLYRYMKSSRKRVDDLDSQIKSMRNGLKGRIDERETLVASINDTYNFLHGLLGVEQIESIDIHYE